MATLYAKAAGGNWSAAGTWSATSFAGADNAGPPTAATDVIFQAGSGNVTIDSSASVAKSVDWSLYIGTLTWASFTLTVSGSITFGSGMTLSGMNTSTNMQMNASGTLTTAGKIVPTTFGISAGTMTLGDDCNCFATAFSTFIASASGILDMNGHKMIGNSVTNRIFIISSTQGSSRTILNCTSTSFQNADFRDIQFTSATDLDLSAITGKSGDAGGNSLTGGGITLTLTPSATQTSTGTASFNWSTHGWTTRVPLPQDDVVVANAFVGGQTITLPLPRCGRSIDFSGVSGSPTLTISTSTFCTGSWTNGAFSSITGAGLALGGRGAYTLTSAGQIFPSSLTFQGVGGTYTLQDALTCLGVLSLFNGTLVSNNFTITSSTFVASTAFTRAYTMGTSTHNLTSTATGTVWNVVSSLLTLSAASSTIALSTASTNVRTFAGAALSYGTLQNTVANSPGSTTVTGANTFQNLNIGSGRIVTFPSSTTTTVNGNLVASGSYQGYIYLPGVNGHYISAPDSTALSITGDITIDVKLSFASWTTLTAATITGKSNGAGLQSYVFQILANGRLRMFTSSDGTTLIGPSDSTVSTSFGAGSSGWIRVAVQVNDGAGHNLVKFYTSPDGSTWTQLGTTITNAGATTIFDGTQALEIGSQQLGTVNPLAASVYNVKIYNSYLQNASGTPVFNADFTTKTLEANSFVESSVNAATVTIQGTLAQVGDGRVSLVSSIGATAATLANGNGGQQNQIDFASLQDLTVTGGTGWLAGIHSKSVSNTTGWTFSACSTPSGGTRVWSDTLSWYNNIVPLASTDTYLDSTSGLLTIDSGAVCRSLDCTGYTSTLTHTAAIALTIGDATAGLGNNAFKLSAGMTYSVLASSSQITFASTSTTLQSIDLAGKVRGNIVFNSAGKWAFVSNDSFGNGVTINSGTIQTDGLSNNSGLSHSWTSLSSSNSSTRSINLGSSTITLTSSGPCNLSNITGLTFSALSSTIICSAGNATFTSGVLSFGVISFTGSAAAVVQAAGSTFVTLSRTGTAVKTDTFQFTGSVTVTGSLILNGNSVTNRILVQSTSIGTQITITNTGATNTWSNVDFMDIGLSTAYDASSLITVPGGAGDCGGNSNITFTPSITSYWGGAHLTGSYLQLPGVTGSYASAPDSAALSITSDLTIDVKVAMTDWTPTIASTLVGKENISTNTSYTFYLETNGKLVLQTGPSGVVTITSTSSIATGFTDGTLNWVRVSFQANDSSGHNIIKFYTSSDGSSWSQLGTTITNAGATSIFDSSASLEIGSDRVGTIQLASGNFYQVKIYNSYLQASSGTPVFNADFTAQSANTRSFTESSSNAAVVSINTSGGNWSDITRWNNRVPLPQDTVNMGANFAASQTVTADMPRLGGSIDWTGLTGSPIWAQSSVAFSLFGSLTMINAMSVTGSQQVTLAGRSSGLTITSAGKAIAGNILLINAPSGTYTLQDAFVSPSANFQVNFGTFSANNFNVSTSFFLANNSATINMGSGVWSLLNSGSGGTNQSSFASTCTVNCGTSLILFPTATTFSLSFKGGGKIYNNLQYTVANSTGSLVITGANTFNNITIGSGRILSMPSSTTNAINGVLTAQGVANQYLRLPGVAANYVSSPDSVPLSIVGDMTIDAKISLDDWTPTGNHIVNKWGNGGNRSYIFAVDVTGKLEFFFSNDGTSISYNVLSTVAPTISDGGILWIRGSYQVSDGSGNHVTKFYTSPDGSTWTQLGTTVTVSGTLSTFDSTQILEIGSQLSGTTADLVGNVYNVKIYNSYLQAAAGTPVFNADFTTKAVGANSFIESSTNAATVTINGTLAQVGDGRISLVSSSGGVPATVSTTQAIQRGAYLSIQDWSVTPATNTWFAGQTSTSVSGNSGWIFDSPHKVTSSNINFAAGLWNLIDATSLLDSEVNNSGLVTSYIVSSTFTPGAITIDALALKLATVSGAVGTITVALDSGGSTVTGTVVTVNIANLPICDGPSNQGGWYFFKLPAPKTLSAATAYSIKTLISAGASGINVWRDATAGNLSRMLRTTTTATTAGLETLYIAGDDNGTTINTWTVVMDNADAGVGQWAGIAICKNGILSFGTS